MARLPRLSVGGVPHLLAQTGLRQPEVFGFAEDRDLFRELLGEVTQGLGVALHAYALSGHELRLLFTPPQADTTGRMMQTLGRRYGNVFNRRHGRQGALWDGRFRATLIDPRSHLVPAMRWLEEAALADSVSSSRAHHVGQRHDPLVSDHPQFWSLGNTPFEREMAYRRLLAEPLSVAEAGRLAEAVRKAWPLGSEDFLAELGQRTERRLTPLRRGRPPKTHPAEKPDPIKEG